MQRPTKEKLIFSCQVPKQYGILDIRLKPCDRLLPEFFKYSGDVFQRCSMPIFHARLARSESGKLKNQVSLGDSTMDDLN